MLDYKTLSLDIVFIQYIVDRYFFLFAFTDVLYETDMVPDGPRGEKIRFIMFRQLRIHDFHIYRLIRAFAVRTRPLRHSTEETLLASHMLNRRTRGFIFSLVGKAWRQVLPRFV